MSDKITGTGQCLCASVKILATTMSTQMGACHCGMCRKWGGGPLLAIDCGSEVFFQGEESIGIYKSSDWAERGFCKNCGTHLFYRLKAKDLFILPVGLFDEFEPIVFDHQIFIDKKPHYYCFANTTVEKTEAEVFAEYA